MQLRSPTPPRRPAHLPLAVALALALAACGGSSAGDAPDAATSPDAASDGGVPTGRPTSRVEVLEDRWINPEDGSASPNARVEGYYFDGPQLPWHKRVAAAGDCVLDAYTPALCDPACTTGVCVDADVCVVPPRFTPAGQMTVTGLAVPLTIAGPSGYYNPMTALPDALFADDATVVVQLAGATVPAHTLTTRGVPELVAAIGDFVTLTPGQDHTVTWTPAAGDSRVRLTINANNQGHGAPYAAIITCDVADSAGQVTVAAALIDAFPATTPWSVCAGSDCPPSTLRRYHEARVPIPAGEAALVVGSQVSFGVDHPAP